MATGEADRILLAQISGTAARLARVREWDPQIEALAVDELRELAGGRADLLAEAAGLQLGASEGRPDAEWRQRGAALCVAAGADRSKVERWADVVRERARLASRRPYTGSGEPGLAPSRPPTLPGYPCQRWEALQGRKMARII